MAFNSARGFGLLGPGPMNNYDNKDPFELLKRQIGFSDEPIQDDQGFWTVGYGQRLSDKPGGPRPDATMSEPMAAEMLRLSVDQDSNQSDASNDDGDSQPTIDEQGTPNIPIAADTTPPSNDNFPKGTFPSDEACKAAGIECLGGKNMTPEEYEQCRIAERLCNQAAAFGKAQPENWRLIERFPHGRTVVIPGEGYLPYLGPMAPTRRRP